MNNIICIKCNTDKGIVFLNGVSICNHCLKEVIQYAKEQGFELNILDKYLVENIKDEQE